MSENINLTPLKQRFEGIAQSAEQYPVDFDDAWQWIGYSTKQKGLNMLTANFEEGLDFLTKRLKSTGGRPAEEYRLTVDCFKSFCMMAGTEKGKEVRKYYLAVEKAFTAVRRPRLSDEAQSIETFLNRFGLHIRFVPVNCIF